MIWLLFPLLLMPPSADTQLYKLIHKLCPNEQYTLYRSERAAHPRKDLHLISIKNCQQEVQKVNVFNVTYCDQNRLEINTTEYWKKFALIRVDARLGKIGVCSPDEYTYDKRRKMLIAYRRCNQYRPRRKDPIRVYLLCDKRLPESKMVLVVSSPPEEILRNFTVEAMIIGSTLGFLLGFIIIFLQLRLFCKKHVIKKRRSYPWLRRIGKISAPTAPLIPPSPGQNAPSPEPPPLSEAENEQKQSVSKANKSAPAGKK